MKIFKIAVLLGGLMLMAAPALLAQNDNLDFKLVNKTGVNIQSIYVCPHNSDEWGDDVMEDDILRNGESLDLSFHPKANAKLWDLRVEDKEGESIEWESLDLTQINELTLRMVKGKPVADWK